MMKSMDLQHLGQLIKTERKRRGMTQADVAKGIQDVAGLEIKQNTISEWETGMRNPGFLGIYHLCRFWDMTLDGLLGLEEERTLHIELTTEERDAVLSMFHECKDESEIATLHSKLHFLEQYIHALFSRARSK